MKQEVQNKLNKNSHKKDTNIKINKITDHSIISNTEEHIKKWINMTGTLSENSFQDCSSGCFSSVLL